MESPSRYSNAKHNVLGRSARSAPAAATSAPGVRFTPATPRSDASTATPGSGGRPSLFVGVAFLLRRRLSSRAFAQPRLGSTSHHKRLHAHDLDTPFENSTNPHHLMTIGNQAWARR